MSRSVDRDMTEQIQQHLELMVVQNVVLGMDPKDARVAALRKFGGVEQIKEQVRYERSFPWIEQLAQDVRYGIRMLRNQLGFTVLIVSVLGVGIGASTAIFSVVNGVVLRPLAYPESRRLVALFENRLPNRSQTSVAPGAFFAWQKESTSLESVALTEGFAFVMTGAGEPARKFGFKVTGGFFRVMGDTPYLGRTFDNRDLAQGQTQVVVLNYKFWKSQFAADPAAVGQKVRLNDSVYTVIGVMPPSFYPEPMTDPWLFIPLDLPPGLMDNRSGGWQRGVGRLKPGVTVQQAASELSVLSSALPRHVAVGEPKFGATVVPMLENQVGEIRPTLLILLGAVATLLAVACGNVANLLLARANMRSREIAVRSALGASRGRIIRQLMCESLLLAGFGCVAGAILAYVSKDFLLSLTPIGLPRLSQVSIDGDALLFACVASALTGIAFGLFPALQASRVDLGEAMKSGTNGSGDARKSRLRNLLVAAEVALAIVLLFDASLLVRSFRKLTEVDMGYEIGRGVSFAPPLILIGERYDSPDKQLLFVHQVLERFGTIPGIEDIAFASAHPMFGSGVRTVESDRKANQSQTDVTPANVYVVSPRYFHLFRIHLRSGRLFDEHDRNGSSPVAIVSESFAHKLSPTADVIGRTVRVQDTDTWREVVGVVNDVHENGPGVEPRGQVYEPVFQHPISRGNLIFRLQKTNAVPRPVLRRELDTVDPNLPFSDMQEPMDVFWLSSIGVQRFATVLFGAFACVAVVLSALGIYGVVSYGVSQRTKEIGIRIALGARAMDVQRMIFSQTGKVVGFGILLGLGGAAATARIVASLLYKVDSLDHWTLVTVPSLLVAVAIVACWLPARRATKVDPIAALRNE